MNMSYVVEGPYSPYTEYYNSAEYSDVRVIVGGKTFQCHKIVLAKSIPWFKAAFNFQPNSIIELKDFVQVSGFTEILKYSYSGNFTINEENIANLIESSCYLNVDYIRDKCSEYVEKLDLRDKLIDVFITTWKHDLNQASGIIRNRIVANFSEILNKGGIVDMTLAELKALLFYERDASKDASKSKSEDISEIEVISIHPKLALMAIMEWTCSDEDHLTGVTDLLNSLDLMIIHKDDISQVCGKYEQLIESNPVNFNPLFSRFLKDNVRSQLDVPKPTNFYVASFEDDFIRVYVCSLEGNSWSLRLMDEGLMEVINPFTKEEILNFGVYEGSVYFLTSEVTSDGHEYGIRKLHKKREFGTCRYYWDWVHLELPMVSGYVWMQLMINRTEKFTIYNFYESFIIISSWSEDGWMIEQEIVRKEVKDHFLFQFADNRFGQPISLCSLPITQIPELRSSSDADQVCTLHDEIYAFQRKPTKGYVFNVKKKRWSDLPIIPTSEDGLVEFCADVRGRVIVILSSKETFEWVRETGKWIELSKFPAVPAHIAIGY